MKIKKTLSALMVAAMELSAAPLQPPAGAPRSKRVLHPSAAKAAQQQHLIKTFF